jgi:hypothetical protein
MIVVALIIAAAVTVMTYFSAERKTARRLRRDRENHTAMTDEVLPPPQP